MIVPKRAGHRLRIGDRRRATGHSSGLLTPSRVNRRAPSRSISAFSASRTSCDGSVSPVSPAALARSPSSIASIVCFDFLSHSEHCRWHPLMSRSTRGPGARHAPPRLASSPTDSLWTNDIRPETSMVAEAEIDNAGRRSLEVLKYDGAEGRF